MGCSLSRLDNEEAVQLCKDRKNFIKQAVEQRLKFASGHIAYVQCMKRVSVALREYVEGDESHETIPGVISVTPFKSELKSSYKICYFQSSGNSSVSVEERPPQSPETFRVEAYAPVHQFGMDGIFEYQSSPVNSSSFRYSPNNRSNYYPPLSQASQWDFFWNPFSSLDYHGYPTKNSFGQANVDGENEKLWQVLEDEGIPELEEETVQEGIDNMTSKKLNEGGKVNEIGDRDEADADVNEEEHETKKPAQRSQSNEKQSIEVEKSKNIGQIITKENMVSGCELKEETPGFTAYVDRRPTTIADVIKDLEDQFMAVCNAAKEVSSILETSRAKYSSSANDLTALKMLNPVALFRSASPRSSRPRFFDNISNSKRDEGDESSSDFSDESCMFSESHQSTLNRLYAWEKKLYQEVRDGARVRMAYEKKCTLLRNQEMKGQDHYLVDRTRDAIRDLHTKMKISIHSVEVVSKRIETLRDEELEPQILELVHGLARMWEVMAECHRLQKRTIDEAKILLARTPSKPARKEKYTIMPPLEWHNLHQSAANLETELRNWRSCFDMWVVSQRSYVHALAGWLSCCIRADTNLVKQPFSSPASLGAPPIFRTCSQWSEVLDTIHEAPVLNGLDFFAAGLGSLCTKLQEDLCRHSEGSKKFEGAIVGNKKEEVVEADYLEDEEVTAEKTAEFALRVLYAGVSVSVTSLTEFAVSSAEKYADLVKQWDDKIQQPGLS
ncbi:hypothetical protein F511_09606 [Dorcoceras hygrometricum]|uniref:DUF632 domain-containing protein n=1 Tax=Dorcoceras hygrometricum TaxID=472368 RepID=A0A2Z7CPM1_9LAMI|nr:hypothetical protein F511_09606 [Dorcoceras hygrometricum]